MYENIQLVNMIYKFLAYIKSREGNDRLIDFKDRNTFLGREENYKEQIAADAQKALQDVNWTEAWINNGKILSCAYKAMSCAKNLVYPNQQVDFKNRINPEHKDFRAGAARALYNIYKSKDIEAEAKAFSEAKKVFGGSYDTIAYLFFIKNNANYLPVSPGNFEKSLRSVGIDYQLSRQCGWDSYIGFIDKVKTVQAVIRDYLRGAKTRSGMLVPENIVSYDLPENRWVKEILRDYSVRLNEFRDALEGTIRIYRDRLSEYNAYRDTIRARAATTAIEHFLEYSEMAAQLLKVNAILRFQDWFQTVKPLSNREIPHALTRDPRYSILYRMYRELHYDTIRLRYGDFYTYGWASTDRMYEMWCYFKLARILTSEAGGFVIKEWISEKIATEILVPELRSGSYVIFEKGDNQIRMYYDAVVSERSIDTSMENPVFTRGMHRRPDGRLDIYVNGEYRKSIVFDCKYRRLTGSSFGKGYSGGDSDTSYRYLLLQTKDDPDCRRRQTKGRCGRPIDEAEFHAYPVRFEQFS